MSGFRMGRLLRCEHKKKSILLKRRQNVYQSFVLSVNCDCITCSHSLCTASCGNVITHLCSRSNADANPTDTYCCTRCRGGTHVRQAHSTHAAPARHV